MTIQLTPEQEKIIRDEIASGASRSAEEVISRALSLLREKGHLADRESEQQAARAVREMVRFVEQNRTRLHDISVKELIREGRRV